MSNWRINTRSEHPDSRHADSGWSSGWQTAESKPVRRKKKGSMLWPLFVVCSLAVLFVLVRGLV